MWNNLDHLATLFALGTPLLWVIVQIRRIMRQTDADHQKISVLWRAHGYDGWSGREQRRNQRHE